MEPVTLTPDTIQQLKKVLLQGFEEAGLVLLPRDAAKFSLKYYETRNKLLQQEWVTAHKAAKYALVPTIKSVDTYKNYIKNALKNQLNWNIQKTIILKAFRAHGPKTLILKAFRARGPKTLILKAFSPLMRYSKGSLILHGPHGSSASMDQ